MNQLFDPISFGNQSIIWNYRAISNTPTEGYYHWHQCCEILLVHEGNGTVVVNHQTYEIRQGMLFFFQPFELHKVFAQITPEFPYTRTVIHLNPVIIERYLHLFPQRCHLFSQLWKSPSMERAFDLVNEFDRVNLYYQLYDKANKMRIGNSQEEVVYFMLQLLTTIQAACEDKVKSGKPEQRQERYSETIMRWLEDHYMDKFVLEQLAEELHLSKFYVSRVFKKETDSSIIEYLTARRIKQACHLLETTTFPVEQISAEIGLNNTSHFIKLFKKVVGVTPLKYRNSH